MKKCLKMIVVVPFIVLLLFVCACGKKTRNIPYTEADFTTTLSEIIALEGEEYETYPSIYNGTAYTYEKEYMGRMGKIKYMLDENDELCNVAWIYSAADGNEADIVYKEISASIQKDYGSPEDRSGVNNYGSVWKSEDGNIILSAIISSEANVVQIAFLSPKVSRDADGKLSDATDTKADDTKESAANEDPFAGITIDTIKAANSYESLLKNHSIVAYKSSQYANEDVEDGYLGFDNTILKSDGDSISYLSSAASQSVPFTVIIEKGQNGNYAQKTQFAGESIVETDYDSEEAMKKDLKRLWYFDDNDFANEIITDVSMQDEAYVVTTERKPNGGEYASDTITRYYFLNADNLELLAINEYMPTDSDYGTVLTNTSVTYDTEPDFTIEFAPEPDESVTSEDYDNMSSPDDGEE